MLAFCMWGGTGFAQENPALKQLLSTEGLKNAAISISVKQVSDGKERVAYCPEMALTPASVTKLLPTWFALQENGREDTFRTVVYYTGEIKNGILDGDIIVQAGGDPTPDSRFFPGYSLLKALENAIHTAGIKNIAGHIRVEGAKKGTDIPASWLWEDISNYYAAPYLPFNYRDNTCVLKFRSGQAGTMAQLVGMEPALPGISVYPEVKASVVNKDDAWIYGGPYSTELYVKGSIPANRSVFRVKAALHDPAASFVYELGSILEKKGIRIENREVNDKKKTELLVYRSPALEEIVFHTNKISVNLFAEALGFKVAGRQWTDKVKALLKGAGIDASGVILKDACGLSPMDAVPARVFTDLLVYIAGQDQTAFVRSLPVAGEDGGLAGYCYAFPTLKNNLKAKTGSMTGVRCLSGYLTARDGKRLAFTVLINHYTCTTGQLQKAVGQFLSSL